ncbi:MAG: hypothetical protein ACK55I_44760, partial [bacterium]
HAAQQRNHLGRVLPHGGQVDLQRLVARAHRDLHPTAVKLVGELLPGHVAGTLVEHGGGDRGHALQPAQALHVAVVQPQAQLHHASAHRLGQQRDLHAAGQFGAARAGLQVGRCG